MKGYLKNKSTGFYLTVIAAVLSLIGVISYTQAEVVVPMIIVLVVISLVVEAAMIALLAGIGNKEFLNLTASVNAVILMAAFIQSFIAQLDSLGWWVSGLYTLKQVLGFLIFAALVFIAVVMNVAASFMDLYKEKQ